MIPITANVQIQGLGRAFAKTLDHNRVYLTVPTTRTTHFYDVREGLLGELWGAYGNSVPIVYAKKFNDGVIHECDSKTLENTCGYRTTYFSKDGWSQNLALSCYAPTVSKIVQMVLDPKTSASDLEKVVLDYFKLAVKRHSSDGGLFFTVDDTEWDLEHVCNEVQRVIARRNGIIHDYVAEDVLSMYEAHAHDIFTDEWK